MHRDENGGLPENVGQLCGTHVTAPRDPNVLKMLRTLLLISGAGRRQSESRRSGCDFEEVGRTTRLNIGPCQIIPNVQRPFAAAVEAEARLSGAFLNYKEPAGIVSGVLAGAALSLIDRQVKPDEVDVRLHYRPVERSQYLRAWRRAFLSCCQRHQPALLCIVNRARLETLVQVSIGRSDTSSLPARAVRIDDGIGITFQQFPANRKNQFFFNLTALFSIVVRAEFGVERPAVQRRDIAQLFFERLLVEIFTVEEDTHVPKLAEGTATLVGRIL